MTGHRVIDVEDLGVRGVLVHLDDRQTLLLMDSGLGHDERIEVLNQAMGQVADD